MRMNVMRHKSPVFSSLFFLQISLKYKKLKDDTYILNLKKKFFSSDDLLLVFFYTYLSALKM